jgi:hypothetical protein
MDAARVCLGQCAARGRVVVWWTTSPSKQDLHTTRGPATRSGQTWAQHGVVVGGRSGSWAGTMLTSPDVDAEQQRQLPSATRTGWSTRTPAARARAARRPSAGRRRWRTCPRTGRSAPSGSGVAPLATRTAVAGVSGDGVTMSCM